MSFLYTCYCRPFELTPKSWALETQFFVLPLRRAAKQFLRGKRGALVSIPSPSTQGSSGVEPCSRLSGQSSEFRVQGGCLPGPTQPRASVQSPEASGVPWNLYKGCILSASGILDWRKLQRGLAPTLGLQDHPLVPGLRLGACEGDPLTGQGCSRVQWKYLLQADSSHSYPGIPLPWGWAPMPWCVIPCMSLGGGRSHTQNA